MNHRHLFDATINMRQCKVVEKVGQCTCFELFDELTNEFLMACAMEKTTLGIFIFSTFRDCHLRGFEDISFLMNDHTAFVAKMTRDWMSGLTFVLYADPENKLCEIKFTSSVFERLPISFKLKLFTQELDGDTAADIPPTRASQAAQSGGFFDNLCISDTSCLEAFEEGSLMGPAVTNNSYTALDAAVQASDTQYLRTRKPLWNREINHWVHNFGGRVKIPSYKNFLVTQTSADEQQSLSERYALAPRRHSSAAEESQADRVCIRHGKCTSNTYILDFRAPVSPLVAFAAMCATQAAKPLVHA